MHHPNICPRLHIQDPSHLKKQITLIQININKSNHKQHHPKHQTKHQNPHKKPHPIPYNHFQHQLTHSMNQKGDF